MAVDDLGDRLPRYPRDRPKDVVAEGRRRVDRDDPLVRDEEHALVGAVTEPEDAVGDLVDDVPLLGHRRALGDLGHGVRSRLAPPPRRCGEVARRGMACGGHLPSIVSGDRPTVGAMVAAARLVRACGDPGRVPGPTSVTGEAAAGTSPVVGRSGRPRRRCRVDGFNTEAAAGAWRPRMACAATRGTFSMCSFCYDRRAARQLSAGVYAPGADQQAYDASDSSPLRGQICWKELEGEPEVELVALTQLDLERGEALQQPGIVESARVDGP